MLDHDVRRYVPELPKLDQPIQVRHLFAVRKRTARLLPVAPTRWLECPGCMDEGGRTAAHRRSETIRVPPQANSSAYSNSDFFLLAIIVERVTGKSLADFANERLFRPLKMNHTFYSTDPSIIVDHRATGYQRKWRTRRYHEFELRSGTIGPFGLKTTLEDLLRWDQSLHNNWPAGGSFFEEFAKTGCLIGNRHCLESFPATSYRGADRHWYTGGMPGFMAQFVRFPKHQLAIILLCNISDPDEWSQMRRKRRNR